MALIFFNVPGASLEQIVPADLLAEVRQQGHLRPIPMSDAEILRNAGESGSYGEAYGALAKDPHRGRTC
jgi:hypothetical protein